MHSQHQLLTIVLLSCLVNLGWTCEVLCGAPTFLDQDGLCSYCLPGYGYDPDFNNCIKCKTVEEGFCVYYLYASPLLWGHIACLFCLIVFALVVLSSPNYSLLTKLTERRVPLSPLVTYGTAFLICNRLVNFALFKDPQKSKFHRLYSTFLLFLTYSMISAVFIPTQLANRSHPEPYLHFTEIQVVFIPVYISALLILAKIISALFSATYTQLTQYIFRKEEFDFKLMNMLIFSFFVIGGLVAACYVCVGKTRTRQDIWAANFLICFIIEFAFLPTIAMFTQTVLIHLLPEKNSKLRQVLATMIDSNMITLREQNKPGRHYRVPNYSVVGEQAGNTPNVDSPISPDNSSPARFTQG